MVTMADVQLVRIAGLSIHTMYIHIHTYIHIYIHTYMYTYIHIYIHTYIHTSYIHTCIHTCMYTYISTTIATKADDKPIMDSWNWPISPEGTSTRLGITLEG